MQDYLPVTKNLHKIHYFDNFSLLYYESFKITIGKMKIGNKISRDYYY